MVAARDALKYDPARYHRRSIRLYGYDYATPGAYFVTICTHQRRMFSNLPKIRRAAEECWLGIANHVEAVELNEWEVMPNHVHGIIVIVERSEAVDGIRPFVHFSKCYNRYSRHRPSGQTLPARLAAAKLLSRKR